MTRGPKARPGQIVFERQDKLSAVVRGLSKVFAAAYLETPEIDARFLVQGILKLDAAEVLRSPDRVAGDFAEALSAAAARRLMGEPVSRILGQRDFYGRTFKITPDVLDPRPDTETLVNAVLEIAKLKNWHERPIRIADVGTGSGAILVSLLAELQHASGVGTDVSAAALDVARHNAERYGVAGRAEFVQTSALKGVGQPIDLVVSNPPYIITAEIGGLDPEVRNYDPRVALDGGADGFAIYREIAKDISSITGNIVIVLEVGAGQHAHVSDIFEHQLRGMPVGSPELRVDLGGHIRCVAWEIHS